MARDKNRGGDDRLGKRPDDGRGDRSAAPHMPTQLGTALGQGAPTGVYSSPDDEPHPAEKQFGEPLIPMPMEAELEGVLDQGNQAGDVNAFRQFSQASAGADGRTLSAPRGTVDGPYRERQIGDMQYERPDGDEEDYPDREASGHEQDDFEYSDEQRLDMFRMQMFQNSLPTLPPCPGFHVCWLTTTNPRDTIRMRMQLGYRLLRAVDFKGWDQHAMPGGEFAGVISVNEMVAAALPIRLYQMYMKEAHHDAPGREEGKLRSQIQSIASQGQAQNAPVSLDPHTAAIGLHTPRAARFT